MKFFLTILLWGSLLSPCRLGASLIPPSQHIAAEAAEFELARSLAASRGRETGALAAVERILKRTPDNADALALRADLNLRLKRLSAAENDLRKLAVLRPGDREIALSLANLSAARGHARESRHWFHRAFRDGASTDELRLQASQIQGWGDFSQAEHILEKQIRLQGRNTALLLEWAALLRGQPRFMEASEVYREILRKSPNQRSAWRGQAVTQLLAKDYVAASDTATEGLKRFPHDVELLSVRARSRVSLGKHEEAAADFQSLADRNFAGGWIGLGKLARSDLKTAAAFFLKAKTRDPLSAAYHLQKLDSTEPPAFPDHLPPTAENRTRWAELLLSEGFSDAATSSYEKAMLSDSQYFPAQIGVAEAEASGKHYEQALQHLEKLQKDFPENFQIELTRARILSWSKHYEDSVAAYDEILTFHPAHPVVLREKARVNAWGKQMREATRTYEQLWDPPVDELLLAELHGMDGPQRSRHKPFALFEKLDQPDAAPHVREVLERHRASYRIQKTAWLESRAKNAAWNRHFLRAEDTLDELVAFEPGNQEARFDIAQAQAVQGLNRRTVESYRGLLALDPLHQLAGLAMEREDILNDPALSVSYLLLDENGADRVADITRQRIQTSAEFPWGRQTTGRFSFFTWMESPDRFSSTYTAVGPGFDLASTFNEHLSGSASFVYKNYLDPDVPDTLGGSAALSFNAWDWVTLTAAYEHSDVIHNLYAIEQGTQADSIQLAAQSFVNHWLELKGLNTLRFYNDGNTGFEGLYTAGILLLDHPHTLKLVVGGEYRDTEKLSVPIFEDGREVDVIFPYWTPKNYFRGLLSLEWRHDLSRLFFTKAETHYYALRLRGGYDTDANPSIGGDVEWHIDFARRWSFHVIGSVERSPQWNGAGLFSSFTHRF